MKAVTEKLLKQNKGNRKAVAEALVQLREQASENLQLWTEVEYEAAGVWLAEDLLRRSKNNLEHAVALFNLKQPENLVTRDAALDVFFPDMPEEPPHA